MSGLIENSTIARNLVNLQAVKTGFIKKSDSSTCSVSLCFDVLPGILTTLACIIGIIVLNVLQQHYLSINCAIGTLTGAFTVYQEYHAHSMKSYHENNEQLKASIGILDQQNTELKKSLVNFELEKKRLSETVAELKETTETVKNENLQLAKSNITLRENVSNLQSVNKTLEETAHAHVKRLEALKDSLNGIQNATEKDHTQFAHHVKSFIEEVKKLNETSVQFETTGSIIEKTMSTLLQTAEMLQSIFTKINQWKDDKYVNHLIQIQQNLQVQVLQLEKQLARREGQTLQEQKNLGDLSMLKDQFGQALEILNTKTEEIKLEREILEKTVKKVKEINKDKL